jgi:hypothetical protein
MTSYGISRSTPLYRWMAGCAAGSSSGTTASMKLGPGNAGTLESVAQGSGTDSTSLRSMCQALSGTE